MLVDGAQSTYTTQARSDSVQKMPCYSHHVRLAVPRAVFRKRIAYALLWWSEFGVHLVGLSAPQCDPAIVKHRCLSHSRTSPSRPSACWIWSMRWNALLMRRTTLMGVGACGGA